MRRSVLPLLCLSLAVQPLYSQQPLSSSSPPLVKYGKWATLAASVAMNLLAAQAHNKADDAFRVITLACVQDTSRCATLSDGSYADPFLEQKFQESLHQDRSARRWLIGGASALVGTGVMFIWELTRSKTRPGNIPFEPQVGQRNGQTEIGVTFSF